MEITLEEMLSAREHRVETQRDILSRFPYPLVCFTMNIPGPVKDSPLIRRGARLGWQRLLEALNAAHFPVAHQAEHFARYDRQRIAALALKATLDEVCTTPKPGLVDRNNSGSHRDMDMFTFMASAAALTASGRRDTVGARLYLDHQLEGIRGEVARGLPAVAQIGLPALDAALSAGLSRNDAGAVTLAHLIAHVTDTNMIARGGFAEAAAMKERAAQLLEHSFAPSMEELEKLDQLFISKNMSPGGCADLLAITYFLHDWAALGLSEQ